MKTVLRLSLAVILLICTTVANGQLADSTLYKVKLEKFNTQVHNSKIATIASASTIVVGGILIGSNLIANPGDYDHGLGMAGYIVAGAGLVASIPSMINWSVGKRKIREYQLRLDDTRSGFYYGPNQIGLKFAFKF